MSARLEPLDGAVELPLNFQLTLVGRHSSCDVRLESERVSRFHCCLAQVGDGLAVRDLDSTNGTKVNGQRIHRARLRPGDELTIGRFRYRLVIDSSQGGQLPETEFWEPEPTEPGTRDQPGDFKPLIPGTRDDGPEG